jgi:hypothetical protein
VACPDDALGADDASKRILSGTQSRTVKCLISLRRILVLLEYLKKGMRDSVI